MKFLTWKKFNLKLKSISIKSWSNYWTWILLDNLAKCHIHFVLLLAFNRCNSSSSFRIPFEFQVRILFQFHPRVESIFSWLLFPSPQSDPVLPHLYPSRCTFHAIALVHSLRIFRSPCTLNWLFELIDSQVDSQMDSQMDSELYTNYANVNFRFFRKREESELESRKDHPVRRPVRSAGGVVKPTETSPCVHLA